MGKVETLTAYKCRFKYLHRNNPLIEEQREAIKEGVNPEYSFSDFILAYQSYAANMVVGKNTDRAIILTEEKINEREKSSCRMWHLSPSAGKQGKPITVIKKSSGKTYTFGPDSAALYEHHIFAYETDENLYMIFYRQNGSGCKSVFQETANKALQSKGLKLEMDLVVPISDNIDDSSTIKLTLQYTKHDISSDVADNIKGKRKHVIRDLGLNLEANENRSILSIINKMRLGKISKEQAFVLIKAEQGDTVDYNDAELKIKIGHRTKNIQWNEYENMIGTHDISDSLHKAYSATHDFKTALTRLADEYYEEIMKNEV